MTGFIRRVVTGHDKNGKAIVVSDGLAPVVTLNPKRPDRRTSDIWKTHVMPVSITREEPDPTLKIEDIMSLQGTKLRIAELEPEPEWLRNWTPEKAADYFGSQGHAAAATYNPGGRHPMMHRTETIDYAIVLEGEMTLLLDEQDVVLKAGDVLIQRGTIHAWANRSGKRVRILYVVVNGKFDSELAGLLFKSDH